MLPVVAEILRSGFVEGRHRGSWVALGPDGVVIAAAGDADVPMLPRSCNKPLQGVAMLRAGLDLPPELTALAVASHDAEDFHLAGVRRILAAAGLDEGALQTPPDLPLGPAAREEFLRRGGRPSPLVMNCSGKHAGMLATCVLNEWPTATYLDRDHPLQQRILDTFADLTEEAVAHVATDGCGAPLPATSLTGLARGFARLATATSGPEHRVAEAIRRHPEYVSGTRRDECALLHAIPGAIGKVGAEGCFVLALPDGRALALKVDDGGDRARPVLTAALLRHLGWDTGSGVDTDAVRRTGAAPLLGGGHPVGEIRAVLG